MLPKAEGMRGTINCANLRTSKRLQKVLKYLKSRGDFGATTRDIIRSCDVCAVNSIMSELKCNGVEYRKEIGFNPLTEAMICTYFYIGEKNERQN